MQLQRPAQLPLESEGTCRLTKTSAWCWHPPLTSPPMASFQGRQTGAGSMEWVVHC